jgi:hypothetical protein
MTLSRITVGRMSRISKSMSIGILTLTIIKLKSIILFIGTKLNDSEPNNTSQSVYEQDGIKECDNQCNDTRNN